MQVAAKLRYARISPQKCRLVADESRGKNVDDALKTLVFTPKKSARILKKVLESAIANAEHNHGADIDELKVSTIEISVAVALMQLATPVVVVAAPVVTRSRMERPTPWTLAGMLTVGGGSILVVLGSGG